MTTKWEYCIIIEPIRLLAGPTGEKSIEETKNVLLFPGLSEEETEKKEIEENPLYELARLGAEGWELVSHTQRWEAFSEKQKITGIYPVMRVYILKREIPAMRKVKIL
jgi:hypothetical protein